jgi:hypothetical protein
VNSTVGMSALQRGRPTKALGRAVYDLPGLAHQGPLDEFWHAPRPPDATLCRAFRNVIVHATQINGGFYTGEAIALALREWRRLLRGAEPFGIEQRGQCQTAQTVGRAAKKGAAVDVQLKFPRIKMRFHSDEKISSA